MTQSVIELYLYMGSSDKIIEWLKEEGVETRQQAIAKLRPYVGNVVRDTFRLEGSLAGTATGSERILKAFPNEIQRTKEVTLRPTLVKKRTIRGNQSSKNVNSKTKTSR